jgi:hypothetical protein
LELAHPNYNKWAAFFTSLCGKFYLGSHVDGSLAPAPTDASWVAADCDVRGWIYRSVADDVLDLAMAPEQTARDLWVAIADLFQANKAPRAVFLAEQFHSMTQGDLSIDQFCQRMKQTADSLRDVGHTILASQLVLNLLRGLNPRYSSTADDIVNKDVLPSFAAAHNMLVLKELRLANSPRCRLVLLSLQALRRHLPAPTHPAAPPTLVLPPPLLSSMRGTQVLEGAALVVVATTTTTVVVAVATVSSSNKPAVTDNRLPNPLVHGSASVQLLSRLGSALPGALLVVPVCSGKHPRRTLPSRPCNTPCRRSHRSSSSGILLPWLLPSTRCL